MSKKTTNGTGAVKTNSGEGGGGGEFSDANFQSTASNSLGLPRRETKLKIRMGNHNSLDNGPNGAPSNISTSKYHSLRYDFKPASINSEEPSHMEFTSSGQVVIKAPNVEGSLASHTVFRGQRREHVKECLLIIDKDTGEVTLQKLTDNITVKATRSVAPPVINTSTTITNTNNASTNIGNASNSTSTTSNTAATASNSMSNNHSYNSHLHHNNYHNLNNVNNNINNSNSLLQLHTTNNNNNHNNNAINSINISNNNNNISNNLKNLPPVELQLSEESSSDSSSSSQSGSSSSESSSSDSSSASSEPDSGFVF